MSFRELTDEEQVAVLREVAREAARAFGLDVVDVRLVAHLYNTTFAADTADGRRYAVRVGTSSKSTPANIAAQQAWQRAIAAETDVLVPDPLATPDGGWYAEVDSEAFGRPLLATAASWLDGPDVGELDTEVARALGRTMAVLHEHAATWTLPPGAALPRFVEPLFGDEDLLATATGLSVEERAVLDRAFEATAQAFGAVHDGAALRPIHADLHGDNLKWADGRLAVFDFDDSGLGLPALDLAVTVFYLRSGSPAPEQALRAGYAEVAPLPDDDPAHFEAMVAARQLLLANTLLAATTADLRAEAQPYLHVTVDRLRQWLETGTFSRDIPGAAPSTG